MSKFTKGPWKINRLWQHRFVIDNADGHVVADIRCDYAGSKVHTKDVHVANASLVAAAPDLYEALTLLLRRARSDEEILGIPEWVIVECENVLAKARGEL